MRKFERRNSNRRSRGSDRRNSREACKNGDCQQTRGYQARRCWLRRAEDRAAERRREFWKEVQRERVLQAFRKQYQYRKENQLYSKTRKLLKQKVTEEYKSQSRVQYQKNLDHKARSLALMHDQDVTMPTSVQLMLWQQALKNAPVKPKKNR